MSANKWLNAQIAMLSREESEITKDWERVVRELMAYGMEDVTVGRIHTAFVEAGHPLQKREPFMDEAAGT